jgi:hypothetical protein
MDEEGDTNDVTRILASLRFRVFAASREALFDFVIRRPLACHNDCVQQVLDSSRGRRAQPAARCFACLAKLVTKHAPV